MIKSQFRKKTFRGNLIAKLNLIFYKKNKITKKFNIFLPEEKIYFFTLKCQERLIFTDLEYLVTEIDVLMRLDLLLYPFIRFFQAYFKISFNHFSIKIPFVYFFVIKIYTYIFTNTTELNTVRETI